jgi:hypothetical protein
VLLFALSSVLLTRDHQKDDSPTFDEPFHVMAGSEYVANGTYGLNLEHPPLMKLLAGLALDPLHVIPPAPGSRVPSTGGDYFRFLYGNRAPADTIVAAARRPFPWLLATLVVLAWGIGYRVFGEGAGLLAAGLLAFDPNLIGHAALVHTDIGAALAVLAAVGAALAAAARGGRLRWLLAGGCLGLALATKFSAVLLVPVFLLVPFLPWRRRDSRERRRAIAGSMVAILVGIGVLAGVYAVAMRRMPAADAVGAEIDFLRSRDATPAAIEAVARLGRLAPPLGHYAAGLEGVSLLDARGRGTNYLLGRTSSDRFLGYFFVAFLVKSTPSFLLLAAALAVFGGRRLLTPWPLGLLLAAAVFFAAAVRSHFNIGVRHILPVYALLAVAGAGVLARQLKPRLFAWGGAALVGLAALSAVRAHPEEIAYFNAIAGGTAGGARWLSDSNVDWGQDLARLGTYLRARGWERDTTVVAYSGLAANYYARDCRVLDPARPLTPGRYAVSALMETIGPEFVQTFEGEESSRQLRRLLDLLKAHGRRIDRVGASFTIWELPTVEAAILGPTRDG